MSSLRKRNRCLVLNFFVSSFKSALFVFLYLSSFSFTVYSQVCGTSGADGPITTVTSINSYFPVSGEVTLLIGAKSIQLGAVPPTDSYNNNYGNFPIRSGDLLLIIQMQDALINSENNSNYGAGVSNSGADNLGGTGYTDIGFSGKFEYVIALNDVPLTGGLLNFKGGGTGGGTVNQFVNAAATASRGQRRFQIVRVPQYSNLTLASDITTVPYNGIAGGVIAFDVAGNMNFNGFKIDASQKGFRGGFGPNQVGNPGENKAYVYVIPSTDTRSVGKGEGIAGTPRFMYDGYKDFQNGSVEGLPNGSYGKGAPANGGGGGNDSNGGGGGGGNGGQGGVGGKGLPSQGGTFPVGGRPGINLPLDLSRLIMGGGGGGGDANNANSGVRGGVGGGIVLINVDKITGSGVILANGGDGGRGVFGGAPDGAGGGGAGGSVFVRALANSAGATLSIIANGGNGGNTEQDTFEPHSPGGGGGGGVIYYNVPMASVSALANKGLSGLSNNGIGISNGAENGTDGIIYNFSDNNLPNYLKGGGQVCYAQVTTTLTEANPGILGSRNAGTSAIYTLTIHNNSSGGNAGGLQAELKLPSGFTIKDLSTNLVGGSAGPLNPIVSFSNGTYFIGTTVITENYNIPPDGKVIFTIEVDIANDVAPGMHHASAQVNFLDPTRTIQNVNRRISPKNNAFTGSNTFYEAGNAGDVLGQSYDGSQISATVEDVHINAKPQPNNFETTVKECEDNIQGQLSATDADPAHTAATLIYTLHEPYDTSKGTLTLQSNGAFVFVPSTRLFGTIAIKFKVTDPLNDFAIGTLEIKQPIPLIGNSATVTHTSTYGANDGSISIISSGGVGTHSYHWVYPNGTFVTTANISQLQPGKYDLTITDANSCSHKDSYIVRQPPIISLTSTQQICHGEKVASFSFSDPKMNPTSYHINWSANAISAGFESITNIGLPSIISPATQAEIDINVPTSVGAGTYTGTISVTNNEGDTSQPIAFSLTISPLPHKSHVQLIQ